MILQLDPPLPLDTPKGRGLAHLVIDYGPEHDLMWTVFSTANGESWTVPNSQIRMVPNWTMGRPKTETVAAAVCDETMPPEEAARVWGLLAQT
jgi:hypothetical protein